ncbi:hypothetical protein FNV43_RR13745 [Rhamnella rubrinervis]|uniref:MLO-like protein n=1 Tax=Rhamnella rubrinervis TaxID=2594499 RepID=A0A8K0H1R7_9ROSA|nr:hypothetical protein FNV43_RR13745 [Rhamnella rubrinervis]
MAAKTLEETPTWAVSIFGLFFIVLAFSIDAGLHCLTKFLRGRKRKSLTRALEKSKIEMMKMGLISLLLTLSEAPISKICVSQTVANTFLPCKDPLDGQSDHEEPAVSSSVTQLSGSNSNSNLSTTELTLQGYCESKGLVSLISKEGVLQLNVFISVLAVFHVLYCIFTMFLGIAKMRKWKTWEDETRTLEYQIANDPRRFQHTQQTSFGQRHLKFWSNHPLLLWPVCLVRQFFGSVSKVDYLTLRNGFIVANVAEGGNFNFQKFLARAYDDDFERVVGISAHVFYNHYWLPFIPLVVVLVAGTKLEVIISKMCVESFKKSPVVRGSFIVKPNDDLFWFGRPNWLLHLLQFVLIQNSFQLAFLTWTWFEFGQRSCFHRTTEDLVITITMGVIVQFLCGYVTLPLYALVTQMGSGMKRAVFTETVVKGLENWHKNARRSLSKNRSTRSSNSTVSDINDSSITSGTQTKNNGIFTQMSCSMKRAIFTETVVKGLKNWHKNASLSLSKKTSTSTRPASNSDITDFPTDSDIQTKEIAECLQLPPPSTIIISTSSATSSPEIVEERDQVPYNSIINDQNLDDQHVTSSNVSTTPQVLNTVEENPRIIAGGTGTYDGEISFGSSWKKLGSSKYYVGEITSIVEEDASNDHDHSLTNFDV